jgi:Na+-driven multidrug efflux pump
MIFLALISLLFFVFAGQIVTMFTHDAEVLQDGIRCLKIVSVGYIFYAYGMVVGQSFNGAGDTRTPTVISFFGFWMFQIPLAYTLANWMGAGSTGVFSAIPISESLMAVASILIFRQGKWKTIKI